MAKSRERNYARSTGRTQSGIASDVLSIPRLAPVLLRNSKEPVSWCERSWPGGLAPTAGYAQAWVGLRELQASAARSRRPTFSACGLSGRAPRGVGTRRSIASSRKLSWPQPFLFSPHEFCCAFRVELMPGASQQGATGSAAARVRARFPEPQHPLPRA
jgi:hypothetical protein